MSICRSQHLNQYVSQSNGIDDGYCRYSAGTVPWGHTSGPENQQRIDDKKIEVIGLTTAALVSPIFLQEPLHGFPIGLDVYQLLLKQSI